MSATTMHGRTCLITGASSGIGKVTALELARRGAEVLMVGRDPARTAAAVEDVKERSGSSAVSSFLADLSSQASIRALAAEVLSRHQALHVLINNAGALNMKRELTVDGLERTFATNHLAYFQLTALLLPLLKGSGKARIVNVASNAHFRGMMRWDDLQGERGYSGWQVYCDSKLANVLHTLELARRLAGTDVTANCVHPGFVASGFALNNNILFSAMARVAQLFAISEEEGARAQIYLASSPEVEGVTGRYYHRLQEKRPSRAARDEAAARRLWELSEALLTPRG